MPRSGGCQGRSSGHLARDGARGARLPRRVFDLDLALHDRAELLHQEAAKGQVRPERELSLDTDVASEAGRLADSAKTPDEVLASRQIGQALEQAIGALEPRYREVLLLRDVEGLTAPEVAEVLGVSVQAVKSRLHRARLSVRAHVAPLLGISSDAPASPGTCPDVLTLFSQHLEGEISADVCAQMERHLEACGRCRGACDSLKRTLVLCRTTGSSAEVPASVQAKVLVAVRDFLAKNT